MRLTYITGSIVINSSHPFTISPFCKSKISPLLLIAEKQAVVQRQVKCGPLSVTLASHCAYAGMQSMTLSWQSKSKQSWGNGMTSHRQVLLENRDYIFADIKEPRGQKAAGIHSFVSVRRRTKGHSGMHTGGGVIVRAPLLPDAIEWQLI